MDVKKNLTRAELKKAMATNHLMSSERKFRRACAQLVILNKQLVDMQERYRRAKADNFRIFRYNLRLKVSVLEGVRNMYYEYAYRKATDVAQLRQDLHGEAGDIDYMESGSEEEFNDPSSIAL